jgi:DUF4097 and DUF4098 domain-containing protein YvlB
MIEEHYYNLQKIDAQRQKVEEMANAIDLDIESRNTEINHLNEQYHANAFHATEGKIKEGDPISKIAALDELEAHEFQIKELQAILLDEMSSTIEVTQNFQDIITALELQVTSKTADIEIMKSELKEQNSANEREIEILKIENTSLKLKLEDFKSSLSSSESKVEKLRLELETIKIERENNASRSETVPGTGKKLSGMLFSSAYHRPLPLFL